MNIIYKHFQLTIFDLIENEALRNIEVEYEIIC